MADVVYTATFDRIGRTHNPPPLDVHCRSVHDGEYRAPDELLDALTKYARRFCLSKEVEVAATIAGDENGGPRGVVIVGGCRTAGSFTLTRAGGAD